MFNDREASFQSPMLLFLVAIALSSLSLCSAYADITVDPVQSFVSPDPTTTTLADDLYVGDGGHGKVTVDGGSDLLSNVAVLGLGGHTGTVLIEGDGSTWTADHSIWVGGSASSSNQIGPGYLTIRDGAMVNAIFNTVGVRSTGVANVEGHGSTWAGGGFNIGYERNGTLNIQSGGAVVTNGAGFVGRFFPSTGEVNVDGSGSIWSVRADTVIGDYGDGTLNITNGGRVNSNGNLVRVGYRDGGSGTINVKGEDSVWDIANGLIVGISGIGVVGISDGGRVEAGHVMLGYRQRVDSDSYLGTLRMNGGTLETKTLFTNATPAQLTGDGDIFSNGLIADLDIVIDKDHGSVQTISLHDGMDQAIDLHLDLNSAGRLGVGWSDSGTLRIADGREVVSELGQIGYSLGSSGVATIDGAGTSWTATVTMGVGYQGDGVLNITNGAKVYSRFGSLSSGWESSAVVNIIGPGSSWITSDRLYMGNNHATVNLSDQSRLVTGGDLFMTYPHATYDAARGTINLDGGVLDLGGNHLLKGGGTATLNFTDGVLKNAASIDLGQRFVQRGGIFAIDSSSGLTTILGDYSQQASATLVFEINAAELGQFGRLVVEGAYDAAGVIKIVLGYTPVTGDTFHLVDADTFIDNGYTFDFSAAVLADGLAWDTSAFASDGVLGVLLSGDFDGSGDVGQDDLDLVLTHWGDVVADYQAPDVAWAQAAQVTGGVIGQDELALVLQNWGNSLALLEAQLGAIEDTTGLGETEVRGLIPEPGTAAVMVGLVLFALSRRSSRHVIIGA